VNLPRLANEFIIIHCSDSPWGDVEVIDSWHKERGFDLAGGHYCGYNFVVLNGHRSYWSMKDKTRDTDCDGSIEAGRPLSAVGCHALGYNQNSIGICLIGVADFTPRQMARLRWLVSSMRAQFNIPVEHVLGHCETALSGGKTCPNLDMRAFRASLI
jgi:N-acetylmuramoyl-L-alanine amidase